MSPRSITEALSLRDMELIVDALWVLCQSPPANEALLDALEVHQSCDCPVNIGPPEAWAELGWYALQAKNAVLKALGRPPESSRFGLRPILAAQLDRAAADLGLDRRTPRAEIFKLLRKAGQL